MKELEKEFEGRGEVSGRIFKQKLANDNAYLYEVIAEDGSVYYEVFERKINTQFNCVSYPKSNSFGSWAWCFKCRTVSESFEKAAKKFEEIMNKPTKEKKQ